MLALLIFLSVMTASPAVSILRASLKHRGSCELSGSRASFPMTTSAPSHIAPIQLLHHATTAAGTPFQSGGVSPRGS